MSGNTKKQTVFADLPFNARQTIYSRLPSDAKGKLKMVNKFIKNNVVIHRSDNQEQLITKFKDLYDNYVMVLTRYPIELYKRDETVSKTIEVGKALSAFLEYPQDTTDKNILNFMTETVRYFKVLAERIEKQMDERVNNVFLDICATIYENTYLARYIELSMSEATIVENWSPLDDETIKDISKDIDELDKLAVKVRRKSSQSDTDKNSIKSNNSYSSYDVIRMYCWLSELAEDVVRDNYYIKFDFVKFCLQELNYHVSNDTLDDEAILAKLGRFYMSFMGAGVRAIKSIKDSNKIMDVFIDLQYEIMDSEYD
jgi:hypothetical protein